MSYIEGFIIAVPEDKKQAYLELAQQTTRFFTDNGAVRVVETWGKDVPKGEVTDFHRAVQAKPGEVIVFSWVEWPSQAESKAAQKKMKEDPRMQQMNDAPFDGKRMIYGGFETILDIGTAQSGSAGKTSSSQPSA